MKLLMNPIEKQEGSLKESCDKSQSILVIDSVDSLPDKQETAKIRLRNNLNRLNFLCAFLTVCVFYRFSNGYHEVVPSAFARYSNVDDDEMNAQKLFESRVESVFAFLAVIVVILTFSYFTKEGIRPQSHTFLVYSCIISFAASLIILLSIGAILLNNLILLLRILYNEDADATMRNRLLIPRLTCIFYVLFGAWCEIISKQCYDILPKTRNSKSNQPIRPSWLGAMV